MKQFEEVRKLLDKAVGLYNHVDFIENDPIQIPHRFSRKEDIEIAGFLSASIAWGQRKSIIKNANLLMDLMDNSPYQFLMEEKDFGSLTGSYIEHSTGRIACFLWNRFRIFIKTTMDWNKFSQRAFIKKRPFSEP